MRDIMNDVSDDDLRETMENRNSTINRPGIDPGMEDDDDGWDVSGNDFDSGWGSMGSRGGMNRMGGSGGFNDFGGDDDFGMNSFGMNNFGNRGMGANSGFSTMYGNPNNNMQNNNQKSTEDMIFDNGVKAVKGSLNFIKEMIASFKDFDTGCRMHFGKNVFFTSVGVIIASFGLMLLKTPNVYQFIVASLLAMALGSFMFLTNFEKMKNEPQKNKNEDMNFPEENYNDDGFQNDFNSFEDEPEDPEPDLWNETESEDNFSNEEESSPFTNVDTFDMESTYSEPSVTPNEVIDSLPDNTDMMTRQFLYEKLVSVMESQKSNFAEAIVFPEDSKQFLVYCNIVERASSAYRGDDITDMPQVLKVEDRLFYTMIITTKPKWLRSEKAAADFTKEIVNICGFDEETYTVDESITGSAISVNNQLYIKIMKGETAMVTIKDAYEKVKDNVLDTKNKMPVVLGIDENGNVVFQDFLKIYSLLISGEPRSGKSWALKSILAQMMLFKRPSELQFYFVDPKGSSSDFFTMEVPHIKEFIQNNDRVIELLKELCTTEAHRREKLLYDAGGFKNIEDYLSVHPEAEVPYIYVVIDEIMTVSKSMDPEMRREFFDYLSQFVSRLPGYGIRLMIVPHLLKHTVVDKTVTDMIPNRIVVKGSAKSIESIIDVKQKEFPYVLSHPGDMAVKIGDSKTRFVHSIILSSKNSGCDQYFEFLANFWLKIEPESFYGSKLEKDISYRLRSADMYPTLSKLDLSYIKYKPSPFFSVDTSKIEENNTVKRPKLKKSAEEDVDDESETPRPKRPRTRKVVEVEDDEYEEEEVEQVVTRPKRPKTRPVVEEEDSDFEEEAPKPKKRVRSDDSLM